MDRLFCLLILLTAYTCTSQSKKVTLDRNTTNETLYNGIELPQIWPPHYPIPDKEQSMRVPYLEKKPTVIPINKGRQLFIDDFLIETTNLKRAFHYPEYHPQNPILEPDKEWEKTITNGLYAAPFSDGIWYDELDKKFKMWYLCGGATLYQKPQSFVTAYAESTDGIHWEKPNMDVVPGTNIIEKGWRDSNTMWLDKEEKDPQKRYKLFNVENTTLKDRGDRWRMILKYSADGIHWSTGVDSSDYIADRSTVFYNPFRKKWIYSIRSGIRRGDWYSRERNYFEHNDPELGTRSLSSSRDIKAKDVNDGKARYWFGPDPNEPRHPKFPEVRPAIYNHDAIAYESLLLGFFNVWQGPENNVCDSLNIQKRNELLLGYSRDGFHWHRPDLNRFMAVKETADAWNFGNIQSINGVPLIVGDSLYFYASGRRLNEVMWDSHTSTGLATLRRDGFASMDADASEGQLTTRKVTFNGQYLFVNANLAKGILAVEVLDENGQVINGYSKSDCLILKETETKASIQWKTKTTLKELKGKPVRFRFYLTHGELYAFWVSQFNTGESEGYTAGGGPGLHPSGIDLPNLK